jgi:stage II sporulation protein D
MQRLHYQLPTIDEGTDAMTASRRFMGVLACSVLLIGSGCTPEVSPSQAVATANQTIRIRLLPTVAQVAVSATANPLMSFEGDATQRALAFPKDMPILIARDAGGQSASWHIGTAKVPGGVMTFSPGPGGTLSVNQAAYRGSLRFVPIGDQGAFDVINDVQIDDYLKGVLPRELYADWHIEAYKAQAVVARTYALYHSNTDGQNRYWDVWPDERSQMYGGISAESDKSRLAVSATAGLVLTYGDGEGKIFEAYFSSDCGGVTQSAGDAFGGPTIPPLESHPMPNCDHLSPHANWGPIVVSKTELTGRFRAWGSRHTPPRPEANMTGVANVEVAAVNPYGRPKTFKITDANGATYTIAAEEMRAAFNTNAPPGSATTLLSSFCKAKADGDNIVFYDGHGYGHGVGMSQWCAQEQAVGGMTYDQILAAAYPQVKFARGY